MAFNTAGTPPIYAGRAPASGQGAAPPDKGPGAGATADAVYRRRPVNTSPINGMCHGGNHNGTELYNAPRPRFIRLASESSGRDEQAHRHSPAPRPAAFLTSYQRSLAKVPVSEIVRRYLLQMTQPFVDAERPNHERLASDVTYAYETVGMPVERQQQLKTALDIADQFGSRLRQAISAVVEVRPELSPFVQRSVMDACEAAAPAIAEGHDPAPFFRPAELLVIEAAQQELVHNAEQVAETDRMRIARAEESARKN